MFRARATATAWFLNPRSETEMSFEQMQSCGDGMSRDEVSSEWSAMIQMLVSVLGYCLATRRQSHRTAFEDILQIKESKIRQNEKIKIKTII